MRTVGELGEFRLIERIERMLPTAAFVMEGVGDDCAVVRFGEKLLLISSDLFIEDVHFRRRHTEPSLIGWKAAASALSDIAAMGGAPMFCLASLACTAEEEAHAVEEIYTGITSVLDRFGAVIVGGDTTRTPGGLVLDITAAGQVLEGRYLARKGAQAGDLLAITGRPGMAAAGFHAIEHGIDAPELVSAHQRPRPRIAEGQWLCARHEVHAMIDVSDGVAQDAGHVARKSGLGVHIERERIPLAKALVDYCSEHNLSALDMALSGGEDYELLFAMSSDDPERTLRDFHHELRGEVCVIGRFTDKWNGVRVSGEETFPAGFDHFK